MRRELNMTRLKCLLSIVMLYMSTNCLSEAQEMDGPESRVIPLTELSQHIEDSRLPRHVAPTGYRLEIQAFPAEGHFMGRVKINISCREPTDLIFLHAHPELNIRPTGRITVTKINFLKANTDGFGFNERLSIPRFSASLKVLAVKRDPVKQWLMIHLAEKLKKARFYRIELLFDGMLNSNESEALFRSSYQDHKTKERRWFVATQMKPTNARRVFPCFDEPAYKVPFEVSVARPLRMRALSNMPVRETQIIEEEWMWDHFMRTPPIATFSVGILISDLDNLPTIHVNHSMGNVSVRVWGREHFLSRLEGVAAAAQEAVQSLQEKFDIAYPLPELNIVALPHFTHPDPADMWGLVIFQEKVLTSKSSRWFLYNMLVTQWLGHLVTPHWWSDARLNQAIANYLATDHVMQTDHHESWTSSVGYSVYYEFSQHKDAAKQSDAVKTTKTEWLLRMLSKSLTQKTFQAGLQEFMRERQYDTYFEDDIWAGLTKQAWEDKTLEDPVRVEDIARSWIYQDRFPVVTVTRNYTENTATIQQHTFLRGRLRGLPSNDQLLWWIPVAFLTSDDLDLEMDPSSPVTWIKAEKEVTLINLPDRDKFIIVNPDETGMFLVNYDAHHWSLLSEYLATTSGDDTASLPSVVRTKLLHDAWNLAFGSELSFGTALNLTLFLGKDRDLAVWNVMFHMIDQLLARIDSTIAGGKFKDYIARPLRTMYESLPPAAQDEDENLSVLRDRAKAYLCSLAYGPCIDEAMAAYGQWLQHQETMISERYLCTVVKWSYSKEIGNDLKEVMESQRTLSTNRYDRMYYLIQIARCLQNKNAIKSLLNDTLLVNPAMLSLSDKRLLLDQLSTHVQGYSGIFSFMQDNWEEIRTRLQSDSDLWNYLIEKAVCNWKTSSGFQLIKTFYHDHKGELGSAHDIVKEQLKMIAATAGWTDSILPDINNWLDNQLAQSAIQY